MGLLLVLLLGTGVPAITVRLDNDAGVRSADLEFAKRRAGQRVRDDWCAVDLG